MRTSLDLPVSWKVYHATIITVGVPGGYA